MAARFSRQNSNTGVGINENYLHASENMLGSFVRVASREGYCDHVDIYRRYGCADETRATVFKQDMTLMVARADRVGVSHSENRLSIIVQSVHITAFKSSPSMSDDSRLKFRGPDDAFRHPSMRLAVSPPSRGSRCFHNLSGCQTMTGRRRTRNICCQ